jgi:hypothetical protein
MRTPSEKETRAFFEGPNYHLMPIDRSRRSGVVLRFSLEEHVFDSEYPSLRRLWEEWADWAYWLRQRAELVETVVTCWMEGAPKVRRGIERWADWTDQSFADTQLPLCGRGTQ